MRKKFILWVGFTFLFCCVYAYVYADTLMISGSEVPLVQGAVISNTQGSAGSARIKVYSVERPLKEIIDFYEEYLRENGFQVIGGQGPEGFNAAVKKEKTMFTLRIFSERDTRTIIEFIW
jgi:hypothetical protein